MIIETNKFMKNPRCTLKGSFTKKCPISKINTAANTLPLRPLSILAKINYIGMKYLGKFWFLQYFGSIYPGVLAHFSNGTLLDRLLYGQKKSLHEALAVKRKTHYEYSITSGIDEFAKKNGGICTFRLGTTCVIYQTSNIAIVEDKFLEPSTARTERLFGDFMGTLPVDSKIRKRKRAAIESVLGNLSFIRKLEHKLKGIIEHLLSKYEKKEICLERFFQEIVADTVSLAPGIFDFQVKPLSRYFVEFKDTTLDFFESASGFVSGLHKTTSEKFPERICLFVKTVLKDNYSSINSAPESNIIKRYFQLWGVPFTLQSIDELNEDYLKGLGTIMVNSFESTSLSLSWAISYVENNSLIKSCVIEEVQKNIKDKNSYIELVILEAIRLGGTIPTISTRSVSQKFELQIGTNKIVVLPGTWLWLNRKEANQDSSIFINPKKFDPSNIKNIMRSENEDIKSMVSKERYEINSFNSINTKDNSRKCPARLYSIYIQSLITRLLYSNYQVDIKNNYLALKENSSIPKPLSFGTIQINKSVKR